MSQELMDRLDRLRDLAGIPIVLNSAYRSVAWEKKKGRSGTSTHCKGQAVDIRCTTMVNRFKIMENALKCGFTRIGVAKSYIHLDIDSAKSQRVLWGYSDNNKTW